MGHNKSFSMSHEDDDFEFDEACFRTFYKPLSNLPTPPLSSRTSSAGPTSPVFAHDVAPEDINTEYIGPAAHLARMLPPSASCIDPSVAMLQGMLGRAQVSMDIIALAVCILDSLKSKFARRWRVSFPLSRGLNIINKRHTLSGPVQAQHIDSVLPEVIALGALMIATKFVEDMQEPTRYFAHVWGQSQWTCEQINFTERCIMESLDYRIMPLWDEDYIKQARHDIEMARREFVDEMAMALQSRGSSGKTGLLRENSIKHGKSMSAGHAVVGAGFNITPADTPRQESLATFAPIVALSPNCVNSLIATRAVVKSPGDVLTEDYFNQDLSAS
ncbi:Cyclin N-terminal domain-containing protein [Microdochium nivale]|nr:Cyclin N-terminal domain-containing protein [Microdochium nivale]